MRGQRTSAIDALMNHMLLKASEDGVQTVCVRFDGKCACTVRTYRADVFTALHGGANSIGEHPTVLDL